MNKIQVLRSDTYSYFITKKIKNQIYEVKKMVIKNVHCLFEQSGTFKNEFLKLGIPAFDYDIRNDFNQTDFICDLFNEIEDCYSGNSSIFDKFDKYDLLFVFFPCTRFENQAQLLFRGEQFQDRDKNDTFLLKRNIDLHNELNRLYCLVSKLALICYSRGLRCIIENPFSTSHYLTRYWCLKPAVIDKNRLQRGDRFIKPTQYWFINCEPEDNFVLEPVQLFMGKVNCICSIRNKVDRSLITSSYAKRFINEFILD